MVKWFQVLILSAFTIVLAACDDKPKAQTWVVLDLAFVDGATAQVALDSPLMRNKSVRQCANALEAAMPDLLKIVHQQPEAEGATIDHARCMRSVQDPVMLANKKKN